MGHLPLAAVAMCTKDALHLHACECYKTRPSCNALVFTKKEICYRHTPHVLIDLQAFVILYTTRIYPNVYIAVNPKINADPNYASPRTVIPKLSRPRWFVFAVHSTKVFVAHPEMPPRGFSICNPILQCAFKNTQEYFQTTMIEPSSPQNSHCFMAIVAELFCSALGGTSMANWQILACHCIH